MLYVDKDRPKTFSDFELHPLVLIHISDHHTRTRANTGADVKVVGCLLGQQFGRTVDISNSFEVNLTAGDPAVLDEAFLTKKLEQYKQTFPLLDLVGWYATGQAPGEHELALHRQILLVNEAPVFLQLNTSLATSSREDLPVALYECEQHAKDGEPSLAFVQVAYSMATSEAERIGVDQVTKILPTVSATGATQLSAHLTGMHSATQMLVTRVATLASLLGKMQEGAVPFDPALARQASALVSRLPAADTAAFVGDNAEEGRDTLMAVLLAALTRGSVAANDLVDKHNLAYERLGSMKRSGKAGPSFPLPM